MQKTAAILSIPLLIVLIFSAYSNTFTSPPVLDDLHTFVFEQNVRLTDLSLSNLMASSKSVFGLQRWLPMMSFSLNHWLGGGDILVFHLTNTIIHVLCTVAVLLLVFSLFTVVSENGRILAVPPIFSAVWVAGLWALHPVQTNGVTYLVQRMAALQALFFITAVACYVWGRRKHQQHASAAAALPSYAACFLASLGAFFSKENSAMLPVMLLVTEIWFFTPDLHRSLWRRLKAAPWFLWALLAAGTLFASWHAAKLLQDFAAGYSIRHFTMGERLLTEARIVVWYLSLLLWPALSRMSLEHDVVVSTSLLHPPTTLGAIAFLAVAGWLVLRYRKRYALITYGGMWFFLNLAIESSIVPLELIFEHRLYLPSVGVALVVVWVLTEGLASLFAGRTTRDLIQVSSCGFLLLFSALTLLTFFRNEVWRDNITVYQDASQKAPNHPRAHANLAIAYAREGLHEAAIHEAETALSLGRERLESSIVAGDAILGSLMKLGKFEEAILRADTLLRNLPERFDTGGLTEFYLNVAQANLKLGRMSQAYSSTMQAFHYAQRSKSAAYETGLVEGMLFKILRDAAGGQWDLNQDGMNDPGTSTIKTWTAKEFLRGGAREKAKSLLRSALRENPADAEAVRLIETVNREDALNQAQMLKENMRQHYQASPFSPFNACMALAYLVRRPELPASLRNMGEKLLDYAIEVQPDTADAHILKAFYLHDRKEIEPAIAATQRALALDANYAKAWLALGFFRMELNDFDAAVTAFKKGLELYPGCPQRQTVFAAITAIEQDPALTTAQN